MRRKGTCLEFVQFFRPCGRGTRQNRADRRPALWDTFWWLGWIGVCGLVSLILVPAAVSAQETPSLPCFSTSPTPEAEVLAWLAARELDAAWIERGDWELRALALAACRMPVIPSPPAEGLLVRSIHVVALEVLDELDPWPTWPNRFHATSRQRTISRLLPIRTGDGWSAALQQDAERGLRDPSVLGVQLVLPVLLPDDPPPAGSVDVLVVTRDVWSLRPVFFVTAAGAFTGLQLGAVETNLLGTHQTLGATFSLGQGNWDIGPVWRARRLGVSRQPWTLEASARLYVARNDGGVEGVSHGWYAARPARTEHDRWSYDLSLSHGDVVERRYAGADLRRWEPAASMDPGDSLQIPEGIPELWRQRQVSARGGLARVWGSDWRWRARGGWDVRWREASLPRSAFADTVSSEAMARLSAAFLRDVAVPDRLESGPELGLGISRNRWFRETDVDSFRVAEELRDGGALELGARWTDPGFGATERAVIPTADAAWRFRIGSGWLQPYASLALRAVAVDGVTSLGWTTGARAVTPPGWGGRWHTRVEATMWPRNGDGARTLLGADVGLRGHAVGTVLVDDHVRWNVEWRSRSGRWLGLWWGGVFFVDGVAGRDRGAPVPVALDTGVGLRLGIPQWGVVLRALDLGWQHEWVAGLQGSDRTAFTPIPVVSIRAGQAF